MYHFWDMLYVSVGTQSIGSNTVGKMLFAQLILKVHWNAVHTKGLERQIKYICLCTIPMLSNLVQQFVIAIWALFEQCLSRLENWPYARHCSFNISNIVFIFFVSNEFFIQINKQVLHKTRVTQCIIVKNVMLKVLKER